MRNLKGGFKSGNCGSFIDGAWYEITPLTLGGGTKQFAIDNLTNGSGATRWCCDSCPWNLTPLTPA
jgi:hypothetical protein